MSARRGLLLLGGYKQLQRNPSVNKALVLANFKQQVRNSSEKINFFYRGINAKPQPNAWKADWVMGIFWWWTLWHIFTQYEELIGNSYPNPADWTDEELGIPPI